MGAQPMDILLAHAYFIDLDPLEQRHLKPFPPLGILYLSSHLKTKGFNVEVFDSTFKKPSDFTHYLDEHRPAIVGIYINLMTKKSALTMMQNCLGRGIKIILGGPDPANYPDEYLQAGADAIVLGEGELTLEELITAFKTKKLDSLEKISGIAFKGAGGGVIKTSSRALIRDLDGQPFPDREAIDLNLYQKAWKKRHGLTSLSLISARGCAFTCRWCSHSVFGFSHRRRTPENTADELENILHRYRPDMVWYADDVFTMSRPWIARYRSELAKRNINIPFETITRADCLDETTIENLAHLGCQKIWVGSESGSQKILDAMDRRVKVEQVTWALQTLKKYGIKTGLFLMLGYPGETTDDLRATLDLLCQGEPDDYLTTVSYPIKGTPYYFEVKELINQNFPWETSTERDWILQGRHPKTYYNHVAQWLKGEYEGHRARGQKEIKNQFYAYKNSLQGRLGMSWSNYRIKIP